MKIKLQNYSLISNDWIDKEIEELKIFRDNCDEGIEWKKDTQNYFIGRINSLRIIKEQLIPSEKLAEATANSVKENERKWDMYDKKISRERPNSFEDNLQDFLTSEIEII